MNLLNSLPSVITKQKKRVGRGYGSGVGAKSGRGQKGQLARNSVPLWFEGGQLPLIKRLPMLRGKHKINVLRAKEAITLSKLNKISDSEITIESLKKAHIVRRATQEVKLISGELTRKIVVKGIRVSAGARKTIEQAGGSIVE
ncbi:MAG: 50S ribosomal protein L15 [Patescibacteria group bacterium]